MTTTSAHPERLDSFVTNTRPTRRSAAVEQRSVAALQRLACCGCIDEFVEVPALIALDTALANMVTNEQFVATIERELRAADQREIDGTVTVDDTKLVAALDSVGVGEAPAAIGFEPSTLIGLPVTSGFIDDPICAATGNMIHQDLDLQFPGIGGALDLRRTYNSVVSGRPGAFGLGMSSVLDVRLVATEGRVTVHLADGAVAHFVHTPTGWGSAGRRLNGFERADDGFIVRTDLRTSYRFDPSGLLTGWTRGVADVVLTRDAAGQIATATEQRSGRSWRLEWADQRVETATTNDGRSVVYRYACDGVAAGRLVRAESRSGHLTYEWVDGYLASVVDPDGVRPFVNEYDRDGRVTRQTSPFGRVTTYRYDTGPSDSGPSGPGGLTVITDQAGTCQAMIHDPRGNLTAVIDADGSAMRLTYDQADRATLVVDRDGAVTQHRFDPLTGDLVERIDPDGRSATWTWDGAGRVIVHTDRGGHQVSYTYLPGLTTPTSITDGTGASAIIAVDTELDRPIRITDADGVTTELHYDLDGQLVAVVDALGHRSELAYDEAGRLAGSVDPLGTITRLIYDGAGRLAGYDRGGVTGTFEHTAAGRIRAGVEPDGAAWSASFGPHGAVASLTDSTGATLRFQYDPSSNLAATSTADGAVYHQFHDEVGRLIGTADPSGATTHLRHDVCGRVIEIVDAAGRTRRRSFDALGRTSEVVAPDGAVTRWTYHPEGQIAGVTSPSGDAVRTELDDCGRVVAVIATTQGVERRSTLTYTAAGRLLERRDPNGRIERLQYDAAGRPIRRTMVTASGSEKVEEYLLDAAGRVIGVDRPGHERTSIERDAVGRAIAQRAISFLRRFEYDPCGRLIARTDGEARREFGYDHRGLLAWATDPAGGRLAYGYDRRGRLIEQTAPGDRLTTFDYDAAGRLAQLTDPAGVISRVVRDASGWVVEQHIGDVGRRRNVGPTGREPRRHDLPDELIASLAPVGGSIEQLVTAGSWPDAEPDGDVRRDLPRDLGGRLLMDRAGTTYRYDDAGRLARIEVLHGTPTTFEYDTDGLLVTVRNASGIRRFGYDVAGRVTTVTVPALGTTTITYDASGRRSTERHPDGSTLEYTWRGLRRLHSITRTDIIGGRHEVVVEPGANRIDHLTVLGARVLDTTTHQFLSPDPLLPVPGTNGSASAYTSAWHDPVNFVDPSGLRPISREDYAAILVREQQGSLGAAWEAIEDDPWGTVMAVGVIAAGAGLMFVPGGQLVGAGILMGAGLSVGFGLASGNLDPRCVAFDGMIGGLAGYAGSLAQAGRITARGLLVTEGLLGASGEVYDQVDDGELRLWDMGAALTAGFATAGIGSRYGDFVATPGQAALLGGTSEATGSVIEQVLTGDHTISVAETLVSGTGGAASGSVVGDGDRGPTSHSAW